MPMNKTEAVTEIDLAPVMEIISRYTEQRWPLIPMLQEVQKVYGYVPPPAIYPIARACGLFPSQIQGVVTFYEQLYTTPRGRNIVRVCRGTACHVRGGKTILKLVKQNLGLEEGETTPDYEYTLETVACIGVCALAPNIVIGNQTYGNMNPKKVSQVLGRREAEK